MNLTQAIKEQAYHMGFSLVGVTTSDPLPHADVFEAWLRQGRHGEMAYLNTPRSRLCRARPDLILPECRSSPRLGYTVPGSITHECKWQNQPIAVWQDSCPTPGERIITTSCPGDYDAWLNSLNHRLGIRSQTAGTPIQVQCWSASWHSALGWDGSARIPA